MSNEDSEEPTAEDRCNRFLPLQDITSQKTAILKTYILHRSFQFKSVPAMKTQQDKFFRVHSFPPGRNTLFISVLPLSFPQQQWEDGRVPVILRAQR